MEKISKLARPRLGITAKVYLWGMLALLFVLTPAAIIAWSFADEQAYLKVDHELEEDLRNAQFDLEEKTEDLAALGRWLVSHKEIEDWFRSRDESTSLGLIEALAQSGSMDYFVIVNSEGHVRTRTRRNEPAIRGDEGSVYLEFARTASGPEFALLEGNATGQVKISLILPVYDKPNVPRGVLVLGFYIDRDYLRNLSRKTGTDLAIVYQDRIAVNTLTDRQGNPLVGQLAPTAVLDAQRESRLTTPVMIETERERYLFKFSPLAYPAQSTKSMLGIAVSVTYLDAERLALLRTFGIGILASVVIVLLFGFLSIYALVRPIRHLTAETQNIAQGDVVTRIDLHRNDELGELARQLDMLRQRILQAWESARLEKKFDAAVIHALTIPVVVTDENHLIITLNPAAEAILKQSRASVINHPWLSLFALSDKDEAVMSPVWRTDAASPNGEIGALIHGRFSLRTTAQVVVDVTSTPVQVDGKMMGYVHSLKDATKVKEFDRIKNEFVLSLAHELQGPLSSWRAALDLLIEVYPSTSTRDLGVILRTLQQSTLKFQGLVEKILDMGRLQIGQFRVRPISVPVHRLIQDSISQIEPLLQTKGQPLELRMNCPANCKAFADPPRVMQVIINLLKNANKYGPEDRPIILSTYKQDSFVFVEVTDHGSGIPPEEQVYLFKRFYRAKRAEEEGAGLGLGLALAKGIVEAHGGQIGVRSPAGEGATFWFSLPEAYSLELELPQ